jgi:hypothetical protein
MILPEICGLVVLVVLITIVVGIKMLDRRN